MRINTIMKSLVATCGLLLFTICAPRVVAQTNTFPASGNAGIGTTSPASPLVVSGDEPSLDYATLRIKPTVTHGGLVIDSANNSSQVHLRFFKAGTPKWQIRVPFQNGTDDLRFYSWSANADVMSLAPNGNVGIGTPSPSSPLVIQGDEQSTDYATVRIKPTVTHGGIVIDSANNSSQVHLRFFKAGAPKWQIRVPFQDGTDDLRVFSWSASADVMSITPSGNVGIGTTAPANKLHVAGSITVDGNINAKYQDVAEWVESSEQLLPGTVVVLDQTKSNQVVASSHAYDTRVAGVISLQPGITLGEKGQNKVLVATTGRVKVLVDASNGPIQVGDLLVTSDIPGVAKKSEPLMLGGVPIHRPGTLIGKALEPLPSGRGEILVLLSLQ